MAGHSQFKNIMHRKGRQDAKRSKIFAKLSREITVAAKLGGPDPESNPRLRLAIQNARAQSMPKDNIERAINRSTGGDAENYEEVRYEGYGPGGASFMFDRVGEIVYKPEAGDADTIMEAAIEAGADDVISDENGHIIICAFEDLGQVSSALTEALGEPESVKTVWKPKTMTELGEEKAATMLKLIQALEDDDDVQNVYSNFEVSDEVMEKLANA